MNMVEATLERANGGARRRGRQTRRWRSTRQSLAARPALRATTAEKVILGIRPEDLEDAALAPDTPDDRRLRGHGRAERGARLGDHGALRRSRRARPHRGGPRSSPRTSATSAVARARGGASRDDNGRPLQRRARRHGRARRVEVAVDTRALHFFDPETGSASTTTDHERGQMMIGTSHSAVGAARAVAASALAAATAPAAQRDRSDGGGRHRASRATISVDRRSGRARSRSRSRR